MSKKLTTEEFKEKARGVHGDRYDYSKVEYVNTDTKVCIVCPEHGEFWQTPTSHLGGNGCPKCSGNKKLTAEEFIEKAREVHGDRYDYSKVEYVNANTKVCIVCPEHGEFWQVPASHLKGIGCQKCGIERRRGARRLSKKEFISRAKETHGDKYDYSKVEYVNFATRVCIVCQEHGEFWQTPANHLGGNGCPKCSGTEKLTAEEFIERSRDVHGDKYDYSKVEYVNTDTKVCIVCPVHGEFWQRPAKHLKGQGCPKCSGKTKLTAEEFIERSRDVHGDRYDYSKVVYANAKTDVRIVCPLHGEFWQAPYSHLSGNGCPKCAGKKKMTTEGFIEKAREVHGDRYDYSKVEYVNSTTKVCIVCQEHGEFWQTSASHLGGNGCPKCSGNKKLTTEEFIDKAREVHGDRYDYSKVVYANAKTDVRIVCPLHGEFWQIPYDHLKGVGCPRCARPNYFTKENKLRLLTENDLENMSHHQLMELISTNVFPNDFKRLAYTESGSDKRKGSIKELIDLYENKDLTEEQVVETIDEDLSEDENRYKEEHLDTTDVDTNDVDMNDIDTDDIDTAEPVSPEQPDEQQPSTQMDEDLLPNADDKLITELVAYDRFGKDLVTYGEKNKFLTEVEIQKIWNNVLSDDSNGSTRTIGLLREQRETSGEWLSYVIDTFFEEYNKVVAVSVDDDYEFPSVPTLMQKLMVHKMSKHDSYLNLCGTGAGKTNAALMSTRALSSKNSVIICPNPVVDTWEKAIMEIYPCSKVVRYQSITDLQGIDNVGSTYIIVNYDKFSIGSLSTKDRIDEFIDVVRPSFVCFDEIQCAKARGENASIRNANLIYFRQQSKEVVGDGLKVLGMTATPLINNLNEVKSILELVTGKEFSEIGNRNSIENIHLAYKNLLLYGFRYVPDYSINVVDTDIKIDGTELKEDLMGMKNSDINDIEGLFVGYKMNAVKDDLTPGTIVYTTFIDRVVPKIERKLREFGVKYGRYTGKESADERTDILSRFARKEFDVLVASAPITTGVDGLQKFSNKIILVSLPWTNAEYAQLVGRINRQGSNFDEVYILFPHVDIELDNGKKWSWDNRRRNIIFKKKTLSDAVVDGVFSYTANISKSKLLKGAIEALRNGEAVRDFEPSRGEIEAEPKVDYTSREYTESVVNETHRRANTSTSATMHQYFRKNADEWRKYHEARDIVRSDWTEDPQQVIADKINALGHVGVVADLGCGRNELKGMVTASYREWLSFDHVANDDTVTEADTTNLLEHVDNDRLDIAVYCLSIWGTNKADYFKEASRMLKPGGLMFIAEPTDKIDQSMMIGDVINNLGFELKEFMPNGKFTYLVYKKK